MFRLFLSLIGRFLNCTFIAGFWNNFSESQALFGFLIVIGSFLYAATSSLK